MLEWIKHIVIVVAMVDWTYKHQLSIDTYQYKYCFCHTSEIWCNVGHDLCHSINMVLNIHRNHKAYWGWGKGVSWFEHMTLYCTMYVSGFEVCICLWLCLVVQMWGDPVLVDRILKSNYGLCSVNMQGSLISAQNM